MRRCVLWLGACLLALGMPAPQVVHAQGSAIPPMEPPIDGSSSLFVINASAGIPENGALLIDIMSYDADVSVTVRQRSTGAQLEGTLTQVEDSRFWVWTPELPWTAGSTFEVEVGNTRGEVVAFQQIEIVAAIELARPSLMTAPSASLISVIGEKTCCRVLSAGLVQGGHCFPIENEASVVLDPGVATGSSAFIASQYLFRFDTGGGMRSVFTTGSFANLVLPAFREQQASYCFAVTAIELATLDEYAYDDVDLCAEHGSLGDVGSSPEEPTDAALDRSVCAAPPVGFEDRWCELNEACTEDDDEVEGIDDCFLYEHICEGAELPVPDKQEPPVIDPPQSTRDAAVEGEDDDSDESPRAASDGDGCDCNIAGLGRAERPPAWAWLVAVALGSLVGRRRRFEPRCATAGAGSRPRSRNISG